ncbi:MAG TPA: GntR family transcriptional regulator [Armatimonadota bacterium]|nr:GntR family transcriptional regulator [Armatimonadota bacterium]
MSRTNILAARPLDRATPVPLYYQIAENLRQAIRDLEAAPEGERAGLPTEVELCRQFGVSRGPVRQALQLLEREGLVSRERGRGTFVARRRLTHELTKLCSVTADMEARGWRPGAQVLRVQAMAPPAHVRHALGLAQGENVWEVYRLRLADDEPVSLQWCYIPCTLTPGLPVQDLAGSLWRIFSDQYGLKLAFAEQTLRTRRATPDEARLLHIEKGEALFVITRTIYDDQTRPVQYLHSLWRGDRYDFTVRLHCDER